MEKQSEKLSKSQEDINRFIAESSVEKLIDCQWVGMLKYGAVKNIESKNPNRGKGLSAARLRLIQKGRTVDEQIRFVFEYFFVNEYNIRKAATEAAKVIEDIKHDVPLGLYSLEADSNE